MYQGSDLSRPLAPFDGECAEDKETRSLTRPWPDPLLGASDTLYFKFVTEHDRGGRPPKVTFHVQTSLPPASFDPVVFNPSP